jgi:hypothetical protein
MDGSELRSQQYRWDGSRQSGWQRSSHARSAWQARPSSLSDCSSAVSTSWAAARRSQIAIRQGRAEGAARGWFDNGQLESEEFFEQGVSHGRRVRYHPSGSLRMETQIVRGELTGAHAEWHESGQLAVRATLLGGVPQGLVEAWHVSGALKSRSIFAHGEMVEREFFPELATSTGK